MRVVMLVLFAASLRGIKFNAAADV